MRWRVIAFAALFLILIDVALRAGVQPAFPENFRMPQTTVMGLDRFVAQAAGRDGARVAVVGDSIVAGVYAHRDHTLSAYLNEAYRADGRDARAFNFGLLGGRPADLLPLTAKLVDERAADVILLNFDYRFHSGRLPVQRSYPELTAADSRFARVVPDAPFVAPRRTLDQRVDEWVGAVWRLYGERGALTAAVLGEAPKQAVAEAGRDWRAGVLGRRVFNKKKGLPAAQLKKAFAIEPIDERNVDVRFLLETLDYAREGGVPVVVFAGPIDREMLTRLGALDEAAYAANMAAAKRLVEAHGGRWVDYSDRVPAEAIGDSHHPLAEGYRLLATDLARVIERDVASAEARRREAVR